MPELSLWKAFSTLPLVAQKTVEDLSPFCMLGTRARQRHPQSYSPYEKPCWWEGGATVRGSRLASSGRCFRRNVEEEDDAHDLC